MEITSIGGGGPSVSSTTHNSSGTWTKPSGAKLVFVECRGGGGSGANMSTGSWAGGGGGHASAWFAASSLGVSETVTVGSGGAAKTTPGHGNVGGKSRTPRQSLGVLD